MTHKHVTTALLYLYCFLGLHFQLTFHDKNCFVDFLVKA